jgi:hypothetical protein
MILVYPYQQIPALLRSNNSCRNLDKSSGLQGVEVPGISKQSAHESGEIVSLIHRPPLTSGDLPGPHFY